MKILSDKKDIEVINTYILQSFREREEKMGIVWNRQAALGEAYTIRIELLISELNDIEKHLDELSGTTIIVEGIRLRIIALDICKSDDEALLLIRYRYIDGI